MSLNFGLELLQGRTSGLTAGTLLNRLIEPRNSASAGSGLVARGSSLSIMEKWV